MRTILVTDYLERTALQFPQKIAFADEKISLSFGELRNEARRIGAAIAQYGIFKQPIVVFMDKEPRCVAAFLGVAYSGNFYTPIDTKMPLERIKKIVEILSPVAVITDIDHAVSAPIFAGTAQILIYEDIQVAQKEENNLDDTIGQVTDSDTLYVLFTSGSTGVPKGVVVPHRAVVAYTEWASAEFSIDEHTIIGNQTPFYFSMSVFDIFQALKNGCTTYIIPHELFSFPVKLMAYLANKQVSLIYWVPSALCIVANLKALGHVQIASLQKILFAGETMPTKQFNMWRETFPCCMFVNLFGPTEVTDICTFFKVDRPIGNDEPLPIGKACGNVGVFVLDENDRMVQGESVGELCVYGTILASGYYNNNEKTVSVFTQNPLNRNYPETIYRTGDLVRYNDRGELLYVGRKDLQVKHMGHRIELGEIESATMTLAEIEQCCCVYEQQRGKIVLFYTGAIEETILFQRLKSLLPVYMLPNRKIHLDELPLNLNGKIDRVALMKNLTE